MTSPRRCNDDRIYESKSHSTSSRKRRHSSTNEESNTTNLINFSFLDYKSYLNHAIQIASGSHSIISDPNDFWMFVNKYESLLKRSGQPILTTPKYYNIENDSPSTIPSDYEKTLSINFNLKISYSEIESRLCEHEHSRIMNRNKLKQFFQIVIHYLDFKQKEKFKKLKKLRKFQKNLPVAQFREEIQAAVCAHQIVVIAGDTGCGKSTQVPQYLNQGGFSNIGKIDLLSFYFDSIFII